VSQLLNILLESDASPLADYKIIVAEQSNDGRRFNRGQLLNAAAQAAVRQKFDSLCFHDVDLLPGDVSLIDGTEDPSKEKAVQDCLDLYERAPRPRPVHIGWAWDRYSYPTYCGGALTVDADDFARCNGFPNQMWGWGGEDDVLAHRLAAIGHKPETFVRPTRRQGLCSIEDEFRFVGISVEERRNVNPRKKEAACRAKEAGGDDGLAQCKVELL